MKHDLKTQFSKTWIIVAAVAAAVAFGVTVAVGLDQIKMRDGQLAKAANELKQLKDQLRAQKSEASGRKRDLAALAENLNGVIAASDGLKSAQQAVIDHQIEMIETQKAQIIAMKNVADIKAASEIRPSSPMPSQVSTNVPIVTPTTVRWWTPPTPGVAAKEIKAAAAEKWKDNYRMVEHEIERQNEGLQKLTKLNVTYHQAIKEIIAKAVEKWPGNYSQAHYEAERQIEALQNLQKR